MVGEKIVRFPAVSPDLFLGASHKRVPLSEPRRQLIAQSLINNSGRAANLIREKPLLPKESAILADLSDFIERAALPNHKAVVIGCFEFPEAIPFVTLFADGIIHGIDGMYNPSSFQDYLAEARRDDVINQEQEERIGYAFTVPLANAATYAPYYLDHYKKFGLAIIRHPQILEPEIYKGVYQSDNNVYLDINHIMIDKVLDVGGIGLITTYQDNERGDEMGMYMKLLTPYVKAGVVELGIKASTGETLLSTYGIRRTDSDRTIAGDDTIFGFKKLREMTDSERNHTRQQVQAIWDEYQRQQEEQKFQGIDAYVEIQRRRG